MQCGVHQHKLGGVWVASQLPLPQTVQCDQFHMGKALVVLSDGSYLMISALEFRVEPSEFLRLPELHEITVPEPDDT